jgi:DNA-binding NarL/FixJ family response regulator
MSITLIYILRANITIALSKQSEKKTSMKILIVDDHAMVRQGIAALLEHAHPGTQVLQACDSAEGLALAARHDDVDAVFLDLSMPGMDGMDALTAFGTLRPALPVIVLTAAEDQDVVRKAFAAGALGYVPKAAPSSTLLSALELVLSGEVFVPGLLLQPSTRPLKPWNHPVGKSPSIGPLTARQAEVLRCLGEGLSNKAIGRRLGLSEKTVKAHVTAIFRALSATGRPEAIYVAREAGLI